MPERFLASGLATVDRLDLGSGNARLFVVWEIRGRLTAGKTASGIPEIDGGCRVEWDPPPCHPAMAWRFMVGGSAAALGPLSVPQDQRHRDLVDPAPQEWRAAVTTLGTRLKEKGKTAAEAGTRLLQMMSDLGLMARTVETTVHSRARIWRRGGDRAEAEEAIGCRITARLEFGHRKVDWSWFGPGPESAPWLLRPEAWSEGIQEWAQWNEMLGRARVREGLKAPTLGDVVLLPHAAAWWAHELGHAAVEGWALPPGTLTLIDDPGAASWPAGFAVDDRGHPAQAAVLQGGQKLGGWISPGRFRRGSVREAAVPALSFTKVEGKGEREGKAGGVPSCTLLAGQVKRGRFDPLSGHLSLLIDDLYQFVKGELVAFPGEALLLMDAGEAWSGARAVDFFRPAYSGQAVCTRQGSVNFVMVGAPTIALSRVLVCPRLSAQE